MELGSYFLFLQEQIKDIIIERVCCFLVLDSVTSTPQWIRQPRPRDETSPTRLCGRRVRVCGVRRGEQAGSKEQGAPAPMQTSFKSVPSVPPGRELWTSWMGVTRSGVEITLRLSAYHRFPEVPAGALESGKVIDPWNPKQGHNVRWVSPARSCVPLSCPATGRPSGTPPHPRLKTTTGGLTRGSLWDP